MGKRVIKHNFSKNAGQYDAHAVVQKKCAERLMDLIKGKSFSRILEIGCGTGTYTQLLGQKYKESEITAVDISKTMVSEAKKKVSGKNMRFLVDDGERMFLDGKHDLITSNAAFQWFEDLDRTLKCFSEALTNKGTLCFSMYGPETFKEFEEVLGVHFGQRKRLSSSRFISLEVLEAILSQYFKKFKLAEEYFTADFISLWDFLHNIKKCGSRGWGLDDGLFIGKHRIRALESTYIEKFKGVIATHHVYFCKASR
ncbi:MAG: malonyl-ACP O-methyltransferase BioC [Candidatus Omnitrophota bacterium]